MSALQLLLDSTSAIGIGTGMSEARNPTTISPQKQGSALSGLSCQSQVEVPDNEHAVTRSQRLPGASLWLVLQSTGTPQRYSILLVL